MTEVYLVEYADADITHVDAGGRVIGIFSTYPKAFDALENDANRNTLATLDMSTADMGVFLYCVESQRTDVDAKVIGSYQISSYTLDPHGG
jgi:hypothetical protein